jgi:hypothetical protein
MLRHLFHDEWIADQKAHDFRRGQSGLLTQNPVVIQFHEHHQPRTDETSLRAEYG